MNRRIAVLAALLLAIPAAAADAKPTTVTVMTRNLYLGADLLKPTKAKSLQKLVDAAGGVLKAVDQNNFPVRAEGLAQEILGAKPDLVGLQEAALWRTEPCDKSPLPPAATDVKYDYLQLLLDNLEGQYRVVAVKPEFDFEVWANTDGNEQTAGPGCPSGSEINGRLTMRDAILARTGVTTSDATTGTFKTRLAVKPAGVQVDVTRGWAAVTATVGGHKFRFVDTHLEAFDNNKTANSTNRNTTVSNGKIREAQAKELVAKGGPATGKVPIVLLGDMNSDVKTEVKPGDSLAYRALLKGGLVERSTSKNTCCIDSDILRVSAGGKASDRNHKVEHVMTNAPKKVKLLKSFATGLKPVNGFWSSDHAGVVSVLQLR